MDLDAAVAFFLAEIRRYHEREANYVRGPTITNAQGIATVVLKRKPGCESCCLLGRHHVSNDMALKISADGESMIACCYAKGCFRLHVEYVFDNGQWRRAL